MLATYINYVAHASTPDIPISLCSPKERTTLDDPYTTTARVVASSPFRQDRSGTQLPSLEEAEIAQELASLKQVAVQQTKTVDEASLNHLAARGYGLQDLVAWHWILSASTAETAATRFDILAEHLGDAVHDFALVPFFVFSRLLLRTDINSRAFVLLLRQAERVLGSSIQHRSSTDGSRSRKTVGLDDLVMLVVRLLRSARRVFPAACVRIAQFWITYARVGQIIRPGEPDTMATEDAVRLSFTYNRILSILALPPHESPYQSVHHRQRAQFMVIRQMSAFGPPLAINREGYRGVTQVQLAHRKTQMERRWAMLKAKSWPPWKEDKLGVDAFVGVDDGISRASESLRQMGEAGYGSSDWEKSANVQAGWDTDRSPTIQTRSTGVPYVEPRRVHAHHVATKGDSERVWVARIKATSTLQEAWTCFLVCKEEKGTLTLPIYTAILKKVFSDEKRKRSQLGSNAGVQSTPQNQNPLPGDGRETFASSYSHNQLISTKEPLPTIETLLDQMVRDRIQLPNRLLAFLLEESRTYQEGVKMLAASKLSGVAKDVLLPWIELPNSDIANLLRSLPNYLFSAYIYFLCKFAWVRRSNRPSPSANHMHLDLALTRRYTSALRYQCASKLVTERNPFYRPPWNSLLILLARPEAVIDVEQAALHPLKHAILKYHRACGLIELMDALGLEMDFTGFKPLCKAFQNAVFSARDILAASEDHHERITAQALLDDGLRFVKRHFWRLGQPIDELLTGSKPSADHFPSPLGPRDETGRIPLLPRLSRVPHPAYLHDYIRLLGQYPDNDGLLEVVNWISTYSPEIMKEAREWSNGLRHMRTCLIAVRAFVEQPLLEHDADEGSLAEGEESYDNSLRRVEKAREIIDSNEHWDGWPTDEEVEHNQPGAPRRLTTTAPRSQDLQQPPQDALDERSVKEQKRPPVVKAFDIAAPHTGHIRVLSLNSPHNKNAISQQLLNELNRYIRDLDSEGREYARHLEKGLQKDVVSRLTRAVIVGSEVDGVFCAGADLKERRNMTSDETNAFLHKLRETLDLLHGLHIPTISAVPSIALGGGLEIALATTFRIFTPATTVGLPETRLGIIPGAGGAPRLHRLLGQTRALDMILTGRRIKGKEALRIGLCDRLYGPQVTEIQTQGIGGEANRQHVMDGALEMAKEICEGGPATTVPLMRMMRSSAPAEQEEKAYDTVLDTNDRNEALRAFAEKRKPVFTGT
ncbi:MAG: hypothetical protein Q9170_005890 [Blastenia crenularia]